MEAFFSGTVIILYFLSRYAAEPIFVVACCLPSLCGAAAMLFLRFGATGGMIAAWRRSKVFRKNRVVAACDRDRFFHRCVKGTSPAYRAAYALFLEGKISAAELASEGVRSVSLRKGRVAFAVAGVGVLCALSVFLTFYFLVPIGETILRTAVAAFHAMIGTLSYCFLSYEYLARAEKAAVRFSFALDGLILRDKKGALPTFSWEKEPFDPDGEKQGAPFAPLRERSPSVPPDVRRKSAGRDAEEKARDLADLREILRALDFPPAP